MTGTMNDPKAYDAYVEEMRKVQYPMLKDATYLDHAGTTLYSKVLMDRFHSDMMGSLFGNPHSASPSSQLSTQLVEDTRLQLLRFFNADPMEYDLVFTANATAAIKLVMEAFRAQDGGFWYGYHVDSHTSLVGVRESAEEHRCFESDGEVERWIETSGQDTATRTKLFAYPAQSNMNGRRLPLDWTSRIQSASTSRCYKLLDAAAYASTSPLDLGTLDVKPDFVALSLYKIFGFPDLGALVVRKASAHIFSGRQYFGGGTVDMVVSLKEQWHAPKTSTVHEQLEDGSLPIHSIIALKAAIQTHSELFGTMQQVARHTEMLAQRLHDELAAMKHSNGVPAATVYGDRESPCGPVVAFNMRNSQGDWVSTYEVEKTATVKRIHIRTGGLCNPGGIATSLGLEPWEMRDNFFSGQRCGGENDIMNGKPTGMVRVSLGAMSVLGDVENFLCFIKEFFVNIGTMPIRADSPMLDVDQYSPAKLHIESLTVYPVKSCGGWQVPYDTPWEVRKEGLAWDREWCVVHQGTGAALSQKRYSRMALIRPQLDFQTGMLVLRQIGKPEEISVRLSLDPSYYAANSSRQCDTNVCGDVVKARLYTSPDVAKFLSTVIGVPCTLARFPSASKTGSSMRHSKSHLRPLSQEPSTPRPILLSN